MLAIRMRGGWANASSLHIVMRAGGKGTVHLMMQERSTSSHAPKKKFGCLSSFPVWIDYRRLVVCAYQTAVAGSQESQHINYLI